METIDIIKDLCKKKGISISGLEKIMGYGNASLSKASKIPFDRIVEIAEYFSVTTDYFVPNKEHNMDQVFPYDERSIEFLSEYQKASPEIQAAIQTLLKASQQQP